MSRADQASSGSIDCGSSIMSRPRVTLLGDPGRHGGDGQLVGLHRGDLVPRDRRRHLGADAGPHRPGPEDRLVRSVLVEVDEHPLAPLLLPPRGGEQIGAPPLQLAGQRHRRGPHLVAVPPGLQPHVDVQPLAAAGLRVGDDAELVEQRLDLAGGLPELVEHDARRGVEVDAQLVGVLEVGGLGRPHVEPEAAQVDRPDHVGDVVDHQRLGLGAVGRGHDRGGQPVGALLGHPLLEERLARWPRSGTAAAAPVDRPSPRMIGPSTAR